MNSLKTWWPSFRKKQSKQTDEKSMTASHHRSDNDSEKAHPPSDQTVEKPQHFIPLPRRMQR